MWRFDDYLSRKACLDLQEATTQVLDSLSATGSMSNIILYGPPGVGKYSCALQYISGFSPSRLGYDKKVIVEGSKGTHIVRMSDVHFEVDVGLLGCNSKQLWNDIFTHITDVVSLRENRQTFVLCKGFDKINSELLDVFHSYMQCTSGPVIKFVILTESIGFIPTSISERCKLIVVPRPKRTEYGRIVKLSRTFDVNKIHNIQALVNGIESNEVERVVEKWLEFLGSPSLFDFDKMRTSIYDMFISNLSVVEVICSLTRRLIKEEKIPSVCEDALVHETYSFLAMYMNNYRPIYHLERYMCFLLTCIHEL